MFLFSFVSCFYFYKKRILPAERRIFLKNKKKKGQFGQILSSKKGNFWTDVQLYSIYIYMFMCVCMRSHCVHKHLHNYQDQPWLGMKLGFARVQKRTETSTLNLREKGTYHACTSQARKKKPFTDPPPQGLLVARADHSVVRVSAQSGFFIDFFQTY